MQRQSDKNEWGRSGGKEVERKKGVDTICDNQISIEMVQMHNIRIRNGNRNRWKNN